MVRLDSRRLPLDDSFLDLLDQGVTLPGDWYYDPGVWRLEHRHIFGKTWQYAGHAGRLHQPGDYFTNHAGIAPVVVTRDEDGQIRAFVNICRHRGHQVVEGSGNKKRLQCPYHAWTFGLDGTLRTAPRSEREPCFDKSTLGLIPLKVDYWGPLIWVNPDLDAAPLSDTLGDLPERVASLGIDINALRWHRHWRSQTEANWKIAVENTIECYHCPTNHPTFSDLVDVHPDNYAVTANDYVSSQVGPVRDQALVPGGLPGVFDARGEISIYQFHFVWPNFMLNVVPGPPNMNVFSLLPTGPEVMHWVGDTLVSDQVTDAWLQTVDDWAAVTAQEDRSLIESVQLGYRTGALPHGQMLLDSETPLQKFQIQVFKALKGTPAAASLV